MQKPGLGFKMPFLHSAIRFDRRILVSDAPEAEYMSQDKKRLVADPITRWRIADPLKFFKTVRDESGARARVDDLVFSDGRFGVKGVPRKALTIAQIARQAHAAKNLPKGMESGLAAESTFEAAIPRLIPSPPIRRLTAFQYDVAPDGQRILINSPLERGAQPPITLVQNWLGGVRR